MSRPLLCLLCLFGCLCCQFVAAEEKKWSPPPVTSSTPFASLRGLKEWRVLVPAQAYQDSVTIRVEAGPKVLPADAPGTIQATLTLSHKDGQSVSTPLTINAAYSARVREQRPSPFSGQATLSIAYWPDGPITASLAWTGDYQPETTPTGTGGISRAVLAKVPPAWQAEIGQWLDEVNTPRSIWGKLPSWNNLPQVLKQAAAGAENPYADLTGFLLRSYDNTFLGRRQPYTLYIPPTLDQSQPAPLMILLHGSRGDYRNIISDHHAGQRFDEHPMLIANAGAYHHQEYRHIAMQDVLQVLEDVASKYKVDRDRIYLQGISLGGRGCLDMPALKPDLFAAVSAQGVYGMMYQLADPGLHLDDDPVARSYRARSDMRTWLPSIQHLSVEFCTGQDDRNTPAEQGLLFARLLRFHGAQKVSHRLFPTDHNISLPSYDWATTREWLLQHRRVPVDQRSDIRFRTGNLRYNCSGWVEIGAFKNYAFPAKILATLQPASTGDETDGSDATPPGLAIATTNTSHIIIAPPTAVTKVIIDGQTLHDGDATKLSWHLQQIDDKWQIQDAAPKPAPGTKRPGCSGPLWDMYSTPVAWVYDDSQGAETDESRAIDLLGYIRHPDRDSLILPTTARVRLGAEHSARWDTAWGNPQLATTALSSLTDEVRSQRTIILFTSDVRSCPLLKDVTLPATFADTPDQLTIAIRPSPWSTDRYLVIVENRHPEALASLPMLGGDNALRSDWLRLAFTPATPPRTGWSTRFIAAGSYDHHWQPQSQTSIDYRSHAMLGPASGGY